MEELTSAQEDFVLEEARDRFYEEWVSRDDENNHTQEIERRNK